MKSRFKLVTKQRTAISIKTVLVYSALCAGLFGALTLLTFLYLNLGNSENAYAAPSYTSNRSGVWTTGSTWNGGTSPTASVPNNTAITINSGHNITLSGNLTMGNDVSITINGTGKLTIAGNFTANNNLTLMVNGELTISGNMSAGNNARVTINGSGKVTTSGNIALGNNATVGVDGEFIGGNNITFGNNSDFKGNGKVAIVGSNCSKWKGPGNCTDNTTLPIELISFVAENTPEGVQLTWKTASELNNDHFTIERSPDGITFSNIGELNGSGTTKVVTEYEYTDSQPLTGSVSYYRLSQTDFDGTTEIFKPIPIEATASSKKQIINVYPNPIIGNTLNVSFSTPEKGTVEFIDSRGYKILSEPVDGFSKSIQLTIDSNIEPGIYYLNFKSGSAKETIKLMKNK